MIDTYAYIWTENISLYLSKVVYSAYSILKLRRLKYQDLKVLHKKPTSKNDAKLAKILS